MADETKLNLAAVKAEIRDSVGDMTDLFLKAANALLLAHGGAMIACLSQLKDYGTNPHLKHIGFAIAAFGLGFCVALLGYIGIGLGRLKLMLAVFKADRKGLEEMPLASGVNLLYVSAGILLVAVLGIVWNFFWL